jgi:acetyl-CoA carboxylase/biotin carboxylase 1
VERIQFQSTPNVWGYFSVGPNGAVHEFADSQFGHVFASGNTREDARKVGVIACARLVALNIATCLTRSVCTGLGPDPLFSVLQALILALKDIVVRGEIRTAVEYLVQLLNTPEFIENTIDTSWLDGLIKEKQLGIDVDPQMVVMSAAVAKAHAHVRNVTDGLLQNFSKGQLGTQGVETLNSFPVEITYRDTKYEFNVTRFAPGMLRFSIGNTVVEAKVREQSDGTLLAWYAGSTHNVTASEDALGLRLTLDGTTHLLPTQFDPSELRTDVTGKLIRFLQPDGAEVKKGKPFAEVEAMKMVMPLVAMETGTINHKKVSNSNNKTIA